MRNASISVQNVTVHPTRTWQYRQSMVNQSITTVKVVNKGINNIPNIAWVTCILPQEMAFRSQVVP